jgi:hypothetical protein
MIRARLTIVIAFTACCCTAFAQDHITISENLFQAVKNNDQKETARLVNMLASANEDQLKSDLNTENKAKAFWINIYNIFVQYLLKADPKLFEDRSSFFTTERITIAGTNLSLDDIEHGIIRHSKIKYSLGYLGKIFVPGFEEKFRLKDLDYRIHFALNCGAKSCPPITLYKADRINEQLNRSTARYLNTFARYDVKKDKAYAPSLCYWYKADFDGEDGVIKLLKEHGIVPTNATPDLDYTEYDWTLSLSNYIDL